jgi:hypothetical protein
MLTRKTRCLSYETEILIKTNWEKPQTNFFLKKKIISNDKIKKENEQKKKVDNPC